MNINEQTKVYHPKGSMCANCQNRLKDCTDLNFNEMRVIKQYKSKEGQINFQVVKCEEFQQ